MILRFLCFFVASGKMSGHFYQPTGKSNQMIDFELTEEHNALVQTVRECAQKEVAPHIKEWDEKQQFDPSVLQKMAALNLLGVCIPAEDGGAAVREISLF